MSSEIMLFIGGPADGRKELVSCGMTYYKVLVPNPLEVFTSNLPHSSIEPQYLSNTVIYKRVWLKEENKEYSVFIPEAGLPCGLIKQLLQGYRTP